MPRASNLALRSTVLDAIVVRRCERDSPEARGRVDLVQEEGKKAACDAAIGFQCRPR